MEQDAKFSDHPTVNFPENWLNSHKIIPVRP